MCKEEVQQRFTVLDAELWEQRANTDVLLRALGEGTRELAHSCTSKQEKKEEEAGERSEGVDPCAKKRFSSSFLSWLLSCGNRGRTVVF